MGCLFFQSIVLAQTMLRQTIPNAKACGNVYIMVVEGMPVYADKSNAV